MPEVGVTAIAAVTITTSEPAITTAGIIAD
jgi:hypothetical protein